LTAGPTVSVSIPERFCGQARRDAAAFYLSQLARGVLSGDMIVVAGQRQTALSTSEFLRLDIEVRQNKRANHIDIKLRWAARPPGRAPAPPPDLPGAAINPIR
jgi:amphi-Trp domain-containing protein